MFPSARKPALCLFLTAMILAALLIWLSGGTAFAAEPDQGSDDTGVASAAPPEPEEMTAVTAVEPAPGAEDESAAAEDGAQSAAAPETAAGTDTGSGEAGADQAGETSTEEGTSTPDTAVTTPYAPLTPDNDGDNATELAVLYEYDNASTGLWVFDPSATGYNAPHAVWGSAPGGWNAANSLVTVSDFNGDGATELAVFYDYGLSCTALWLFDPNGSGYNAPRPIWSSGIGNWELSRSRVSTSDFNGDGRTELAVLYEYNGSSAGLWLFDPNATGYDAPRAVWSSGPGNWNVANSKITSSDFNGDGNTELAVFYDYGLSCTGIWLFDPSASGYSAPRSIWSSGAGGWDWSHSKVITSDYNGDDKTELAVLYDYGNGYSRLWLFDPSATGYGAPRAIWSSGFGGWEWLNSRLVSSDFNGDGRTEIGVFYNYGLSCTGLWLFDPNGSGYNAPRPIWSSGVNNWEYRRGRVPNTRNFQVRSWASGVEWIDINLSTQTLSAMGRWVFEVEEHYFISRSGALMTTLVASGAAATPTPTGNFHVYGMNMYTDMAGPGYYAPAVPFVLWFYGDYSIHGTYWHNSFGAPRSHGCVNLPTPKAEWLFYRARVGMPVIVHY